MGEDHLELGVGQPDDPFSVDQGGFAGKPLKPRRILQPMGQLRAGQIGGGGGGGGGAAFVYQ